MATQEEESALVDQLRRISDQLERLSLFRPREPNETTKELWQQKDISDRLRGSKEAADYFDAGIRRKFSLKKLQEQLDEHKATREDWPEQWFKMLEIVLPESALIQRR